jgi:polar amino acid transport system substrate-binding protein
MKRWRCVLVLAAALAGPDLAKAQSAIPHVWDDKEQLPKPDISKQARIRFLTTTDFPPFNFLDASGRLTGFHVDLARAICKELDIADRCQIQALPWGELEPALGSSQGEAIIAGVSVTAENRAKFAFTRPYLAFPARFVAAAKSELAEPLHEALAGKRVGVIAGSTHERMLRNYFPRVSVVTFSKSEWMFGDLRDGKLDAAFGDGMRLGFWLASKEAAGCCSYAGGAYLAPEYLGYGLAIAARPEDAELVQAFDFALRELSVKGTFAELYLRYFPVGFY